MQVFFQKKAKKFGHVKKKQYFCTRFSKKHGAIAQLVEQRTENPCVPSSILGGTTEKRLSGRFFVPQRGLTRVLRHYALSIIASNILISQFSILGGTTEKEASRPLFCISFHSFGLVNTVDFEWFQMDIDECFFSETFAQSFF